VEVEMKKIVSLFVVALMTAACTDSVAGPDPGPAFLSERAGPGAITVISRNLYVGTDIERIMAVDPGQIPFAVAQAWGEILQTNFPERAEALADEIAAERPHVVGLQEVSLFRMQSPGDFLDGNAEPAEDVALDFLGVLMDALAARGLDYVAAVATTGFDIELPMYTPGGLADIRITDGEAILVRGDVQWANPFWKNYEAFLPAPVGSATVPIFRGWGAVDVTVKGITYRFVSTHLEPGELLPQIQSAQAAELLSWLGNTDLPVILVGDFNSAADGSTTPTYGNLVDAGFVDVWTVGRQRGPGYTCCQESLLDNPVSIVDRRLDIVFYRDRTTLARGRFPGSVQAKLIGDEPSDKTPSGLWPSDHAGVVATLRPEPGLGRRSNVPARVRQSGRPPANPGRPRGAAGTRRLW
jgi:endonuclease/exonuclease/phosphatase family metal-dependent hydrolase